MPRPKARTEIPKTKRAGQDCSEILFAFALEMRFIHPMQNSETLLCPFCGQENTLVLDASAGSQRFTTDCEVCCRPFVVTVECEGDELVSVMADGQ